MTSFKRLLQRKNSNFGDRDKFHSKNIKDVWIFIVYLTELVIDWLKLIDRQRQLAIYGCHSRSIERCCAFTNKQLAISFARATCKNMYALENHTFENCRYLNCFIEQK